MITTSQYAIFSKSGKNVQSSSNQGLRYTKDTKILPNTLNQMAYLKTIPSIPMPQKDIICKN